MPGPVPMANVVATLQGTDLVARDRVYVISAHLDDRAADGLDGVADAPGANDDGSGVAVVLEAARVLAGVPLDATVIFAIFSGEEEGLFGSTHFATQARARKLAIAGVLNNDIVGNSHGGNGVLDNTGIRLFSEGIASNETPGEARVRAAVGGENDSPSRTRPAHPPAGGAVPDQLRGAAGGPARPLLRGGDHIPFNSAGYAAVRFTEPNEDYSRQHQDVPAGVTGTTGDVPAGMDFDYLAQVARADVAALAGLALAPAPPEGVEILTKELSYDTALRLAAVGRGRYRLRHHLAGHHQPRLGAGALRGQRHPLQPGRPVEGRPDLRGARRRSRGKREPGGVPRAGQGRVALRRGAGGFLHHHRDDPEPARAVALGILHHFVRPPAGQEPSSGAR